LHLVRDQVSKLLFTVIWTVDPGYRRQVSLVMVPWVVELLILCYLAAQLVQGPAGSLFTEEIVRRRSVTYGGSSLYARICQVQEALWEWTLDHTAIADYRQQREELDLDALEDQFWLDSDFPVDLDEGEASGAALSTAVGEVAGKASSADNDVVEVADNDVVDLT
jgi:hypothetical protein